MKTIIFCLIAITLVFSTFASSEATSDKKQTVSFQYKCKGTAQCINGTVTKIVDGDTLYVKEIGNGKKHKIRLSLTSTPELKTEKGVEASNFLKNLCRVGSSVIVDQDDKQPYDKHKRVLGKVICDGKNLNAELLSSSHAKISKQFCKKSEFSGEAWAQKYGCEMKRQESKQQIQKESQTQPPQDSDNDTIPDTTDACPTQPETINGFDDMDGCPDVLPPKDSDGDGINDSSDQCPTESETKNSYQDFDGCPDTPPPPPTPEGNQCDPSYPDVCIPPYPPDLDCGDIPYKNFRVLPPDPHGFDRDNDGIGCEK